MVSFKQDTLNTFWMYSRRRIFNTNEIHHRSFSKLFWHMLHKWSTNSHQVSYWIVFCEKNIYWFPLPAFMTRGAGNGSLPLYGLWVTHTQKNRWNKLHVKAILVFFGIYLKKAVSIGFLNTLYRLTFSVFVIDLIDCIVSGHGPQVKFVLGVNTKNTTLPNPSLQTTTWPSG